MRIQWSPLAVDRVCEVADYISQDDPIMKTVWRGSDFFQLPGSAVTNCDGEEFSKQLYTWFGY